MQQKAEQQLAALSLNCASSLDPATVLNTGELEILQLIDPASDATATVADAKSEIERVLNMPRKFITEEILNLRSLTV